MSQSTSSPSVSERVVVLGASDNPRRVASEALELLTAYGHTVIPVNPRLQAIAGQPVLPTLGAVTGPVDTLSMYVRPDIAEPMLAEIPQLAPRRVIFNPGTESTALRSALLDAGIQVQWECTLILLRTGQYLATAA